MEDDDEDETEGICFWGWLWLVVLILRLVFTLEEDFSSSYFLWLGMLDFTGSSFFIYSGSSLLLVLEDLLLSEGSSLNEELDWETEMELEGFIFCFSGSLGR